jgi:anaerobic ribonucleoside-triphosphate reductase activating protein
MLKLAGIIRESIVDGPGVRFVIFVQGCPHGCKGCHNPQTHDFNSGQNVEISDIFAEIRKNPEIRGVTFSGGEPFCQSEALVGLSKKLKKFNYNILAYSGWTFEELIENSKENSSILELLKLCDTLVDGRFVEKLKDLTLKFRGSSNQRIIDLKKTFETGEISLIF